MRGSRGERGRVTATPAGGSGRRVLVDCHSGAGECPGRVVRHLASGDGDASLVSSGVSLSSSRARSGVTRGPRSVCSTSPSTRNTSASSSSVTTSSGEPQARISPSASRPSNRRVGRPLDVVEDDDRDVAFVAGCLDYLQYSWWCRSRNVVGSSSRSTSVSEHHRNPRELFLPAREAADRPRR